MKRIAALLIVGGLLAACDEAPTSSAAKTGLRLPTATAKAPTVKAPTSPVIAPKSPVVPTNPLNTPRSPIGSAGTDSRVNIQGNQLTLQLPSGTPKFETNLDWGKQPSPRPSTRP